jgi:hypothetical protein
MCIVALQRDHVFRLGLGSGGKMVLAAESAEAMAQWTASLSACGVDLVELTSLSDVSPDGSRRALGGDDGEPAADGADATAAAPAGAGAAAAAGVVRVRKLPFRVGEQTGEHYVRGAEAGRAEMSSEGVLGWDGLLYVLPQRAPHVLRFDPLVPYEEGAAVEMEALPMMLLAEVDLHEPLKWLGGALAADGCVYCMPRNAPRVLRVDTRPHPVPAEQRCTVVGDAFEGDDKWSCAVLGSDGCVYGIPFTASRVLRVDPLTQHTTLIGPDLGSDKFKWEGGVAGPDGCIWAVCNSATRLLRITPHTQQVEVIGPNISRARLGADYVSAVLATDGFIYSAPSGAYRWLRIDPTDGSSADVGPRTATIGLGLFKWGSAALGLDHRIYAMPYTATTVTRFDPLTDLAKSVGGCGSSMEFFKFRGAVCGPDGRLWSMPLNTMAVLVVEPGTPSNPEHFWQTKVGLAIAVVASAHMRASDAASAPPRELLARWA